jgi:hypothetical protein
VTAGRRAPIALARFETTGAAVLVTEFNVSAVVCTWVRVEGSWSSVRRRALSCEAIARNACRPLEASWMMLAPRSPAAAATFPSSSTSWSTEARSWCSRPTMLASGWKVLLTPARVPFSAGPRL